MYLCYDIRGIQSFIFRIPKLKYIIGGSALIDRFDRTTMGEVAEKCKVELLFAGGGKGTFCCDETKIEKLKKEILSEAKKIGVDIRFGQSEKYEEASRNAVELFPFVPDSLEGKPCPVSGLYPVKDGEKMHAVVEKRIFERGEKMFRYYEENLFEENGDTVEWPNDLTDCKDAEFFHNVSDKDDDSDRNGRLGAAALGNRNRWAVVCMDGNDMGSQLQHQLREMQGGRFLEKDMPSWIKKMSVAIDKCSRTAAREGVWAVLRAWKADGGEGSVLPIRPIIVGGDDISVLCHVSYAMEFVKKAMEIFKEESKKTPECWPATGGELSISAGVLYCPVSLPLHSAMAYAEALLASAKTRGRKFKEADKVAPTPASIDWESITDSVLMSPAAYRQRALLFKDGDNGREICLTSRPCTLSEYEEIEKLAEKYRGIPVSVRSKILPEMRRNAEERLAFLSALAKNHFELANDLSDSEYAGNSGKFFKKESRWKLNDNETRQTTDVLDALSILEEEKRMDEETVK